MLCQERKKGNSVEVRRGVITDRNKEKQIKEDALYIREDIKRILVDCLVTRNWRMELLSKEWLTVNKETAHRKILRCSNTDHTNLSRYLNKVKYMWFSKTE